MKNLRIIRQTVAELRTRLPRLRLNFVCLPSCVRCASGVGHDGDSLNDEMTLVSFMIEDGEPRTSRAHT